MQVYGNIASEITSRTTNGGKPFYTFRMAENSGPEENRTVTWYEVAAFIAELDADLLSKGQFVKITGRVEASAFMKRDNTPGAALKILTGSVHPWTGDAKKPEGN